MFLNSLWKQQIYQQLSRRNFKPNFWWIFSLDVPLAPVVGNAALYWNVSNFWWKDFLEQYFSNLDPKLISHNNKFWKSVKSLLSDKKIAKEIINLTENEEILGLDTDTAKTFNEYFSNVVQNLNIPRENSLLNTDLYINPVLVAFKKYKHHPSIISIHEKMKDRKAFQVSEIPVKIIKENWDLMPYFILHNFINALPSSEYPASLKYVDITPIFKKDDKTDKTN